MMEEMTDKVNEVVSGGDKKENVEDKNSSSIVMAQEKLRVELDKKHIQGIPAIPILEYLISKCETEEDFSKRVILENKSIEECFEYVLQEVKRVLSEGNGHSMYGWIDDQEVYDMAASYFTQDEVEIDKPRPVSIPKVNTNNEKKTTVIPKEKKAPAEEQMSLFTI